MSPQIVGWGFSCVGLLVGLAYIGVGATVVRAAKPTAGYMLIGIGALQLLMRCCTTGLSFADLTGDTADAAYLGMSLLGMGETVLVGALVAAAAVMLAKAAQPTSPQQ